ncbi:MAG: ribonuclease HII [Candidatus Yonathbacteria bacterium]|nr:ribonuclease HII [Candidatus Yonathbacteria bacterium]
MKPIMHTHIVGIDEAGRGPLAGPVAVGAVMVSYGRLKEFTTLFRGVKDSKKLSAQKREAWFKKLESAEQAGKVSFQVSFSGSGTIDKRGINIAIARSIAASLKGLLCPPHDSLILLDGGLRAPSEYRSQKTIIRGDEKIMIISLASIAAKVLRDRLMMKFSREFPQYGLEQHKGYGTKEHFKKIKKHGLSKIHRRSFLKKY